MERPKVVDEASWRAEISRLRTLEKAHTRAGDALSAQRRRLPMMRLQKSYRFHGEHGEVTLLDLFEGRRQLIVYHFMFDPEADAGCPGCSWVTDAMSHPAHLHARDVSMVLVGRAPIEKILTYKARMGWTLPWYSSFGSDFNYDMGATTEHGENHMASVFMRDDDGGIYRTYYTENRGVEHLGSHWTYLDMVPYGRQEDWQDSPAGFPQGDQYWTRRHDEYEP